ncbi:nine-cis-epoxycarotenoid dioxygenase 4 [Perilla frutescens var. hirtella]|uniref:Nine-cis-epoxycarotenoid dioxygenase 4 n=1 Tax=Perilla frutescens var. hirtella TaxID=608512 RepID=A0AAD4ISM3_PERFH|nr:nine-cis-epoxycarotenoid dioxygenase 4 [Perilla frutescens var. hirtella]
MEAISSPFLQKYALNYSVTPSSPSLIFQFKISSVRIDGNHVRTPHHQTPIITTSSTTILLPKRPKNDQKIPPKPNSAHPKNDEIIARGNKNSFLVMIFNALDNLISDFIDPPLRPSIDPKHVLSGNFAPVEELPPTACPAVEGSLPPALNGVYIRNGPNPQFIPNGPYHMFDGDGMLHAVTISGGGATFCSRFVKTYKYNLEREIGSPVILNVFSAFNGLPASLARCAVAFGRYLLRQYDPRHGIGGANTSVAMISGKLFALGESDLPYRVRVKSDGDIITIGRHEPFGEAFMTMTAHPKTDAGSGEAFAFRHSIKHPFLSFFRINAEGMKLPEVAIRSLNQASLVHDFVITKNYAIFPDPQIVIEPTEVLKGKPPLRIDVAKVPRLGVIPRYAESDGEMWWVEVAGFNVVHAVNAWEEDGGDTIVMVATNVQPVEHALDRMDLVHASFERVEINVTEKIVRRRSVLSLRNLDFAVINQAYVGKKNRYVYAALGAPMPKIGGVVKIDLSLSTTDAADCTVASRLYPSGCYGGEPFFVPKEPDNPAAAEDDGFVVTYVHNENSNESKFIVMDAKSPNLDIVAAVKLPGRVPYGFHGIFVPQSQLKRL